MKGAEYLCAAASLVTACTVLVRPIREKVFGAEAVREGQNCLLRRAIVEIYYRHLDEKAIRQYEYEVMESCFRAYRDPDGSHFVEHLHDEMKEWTILR